MAPSLLKILRGGRLLALFAGGWAISAHAAPQPRVERLLEVLESIGPGIQNELVIGKADLEALRNRPGWTPELVRAVSEQLEKWDTAPQGPLSMAWNVSSTGAAPPSFPQPAADFLAEIVGRLRTLHELRLNAVSPLGDVLEREVEIAWLNARQPADLEPVLKRIQRWRAVVDPANKLNSVFLNRPSFRNAKMVGEDVFSAALLLSGPEPLLLPEPETDPKSYASRRRIWDELGTWNFPFMKRAEVRQRIYAYDRRFLTAGQKARDELEDLLIRRATADDIRKALARLEQFRVTPILPTQPPPNRGPMQDATPVTDYRDLLTKGSPFFGQTPSPGGLLRPAVPSEALDVYPYAATLLIIDPATTLEEMTAAKTMLRPGLPHLGLELRKALDPLVAP